MPVVRGVRYDRATPHDPDTLGFLVLTNDRWNAKMSQVGVVVIRARISAIEQPHAVPLSSGGFAVVPRLVSLTPSPDPTSAMGATVGALPAAELAAVEDRLCEFLLMDQLLSATPRAQRPAAAPSAYPMWGEIYYAGASIGGETKRFVVVSPNRWNAASGLATAVRTTSRFKGTLDEFPLITRGAARACCGDITTFQVGAFDLRRRHRPVPPTTALADMISIAKGVAVTHELGVALGRAGVTPPPDSLP